MDIKISDLRDATRTPNPLPEEYNWTKESWVADDRIRDISHYIANHVIAALAVDGDGGADEEDNQVLALLCPELTESIWKSAKADEIIRYRIACAAAMGIDKLITKWIERFGSINAGGPPPSSA